jgi:hypothetical protein
MDEATGRIESRLRDERQSLAHDVDELGEKLRTSVDWRAQVDRRPVGMAAAAFGAGVLLALALGRSRRPPPSNRPERPTRSGAGVAALTPAALALLSRWLQAPPVEPPSRRPRPDDREADV